MPRRLRIEYSGVIYHVVARGNGRQDIVRDDRDRERLLEGIAGAVGRHGWSVYAFVSLTNHLHLVLKTPRADLSRGMQVFLSSYANAWARRHRFVGHVFQGRYRTELIEDETYLWTVTRYVHLNPVRAGLVVDPAQWAWSSFPGHAVWLHFWRHLQGSAKRRNLKLGLTRNFHAEQGWMLGSPAFRERIRKLVAQDEVRQERR